MRFLLQERFNRKSALDDISNVCRQTGDGILIHFSICLQYRVQYMYEGLDGGVWNSLISKNLVHYSLSLKCLLIL